MAKDAADVETAGGGPDRRPAPDASAPKPPVTTPPVTKPPVTPDPTRYKDWEKGGRCIDF